MASTKAFSPSKEQPANPTPHVNMQQAGSSYQSSSHADGNKSSTFSTASSRRELADTECISSVVGGQQLGEAVQDWRSDHTSAREAEVQKGLPDLHVNIARLQQEMQERQRKLNRRKEDRLRSEREEEMKMQQAILKVQEVIQKMLGEFAILDEDFERRASSRSSSQASFAPNARKGRQLELKEIDGDAEPAEDTESKYAVRDGEQGNAGSSNRSGPYSRIDDEGETKQDYTEESPQQARKSARQLVAEKLRQDLKSSDSLWIRRPITMFASP